jgi:hypothetical protein
MGTLSSPIHGAAWEDLRFPVNAVSRLGTTDPDWVQFKDDGAGSVGVYALAFDGSGTRDEEVFFIAQIPHGWREGSTLRPHVHWSPTDATAGNVRWVLEYTVASIGGTFGNTSSLTVNAASDQVAGKHQFDALGDITMAGKTISSILVCRLMREATDAADTYNNQDAILFEVDFHYEVDRPGSRQELVK